MFKIALTGGIGTGKTYLSKHFIQMGIPVFYADEEAKKLYENQPFQQKLDELFHHEGLIVNHRVNIPLLSSLVFGDEQKLQALNALVHPAVMELFEQWAGQQHSYAVMMESAIIYEGGLAHYFDKVIVADAPLELRIERIMTRNPNLTREDILQRMARQMPQQEKCCMADLVVCTGETYELSCKKLSADMHF